MAGRGILDLGEYAIGTRRYLPHPGCSSNEWIYPVDLAFTLRSPRRYYSPRDDHGVPMWQRSGIGVCYLPTRVTAWALSHWNRLQDGDASSRAPFLSAVDWLMSFEDARFPYTFDLGRLRAPWYSCMAQGEGASVLLRAAVLTNESRFADTAARAIEPMKSRIEDGGVQGELDGDVFLEEYPDGDAVHVLNGFLYALVGLIDMDRFDAGGTSGQLLDALSCTLERHIGRWDLGKWSSYDLSHERDGGPINACTPAYHSLHATLLAYIASRKQLEACGKCAGRWRRGSGHPLARARAMAGKIRYRLKHPPPS